MSERPKEHDWKSCVRPQRCTAGSNPALSAILKMYDVYILQSELDNEKIFVSES